jgi:hypothetical protein
MASSSSHRVMAVAPPLAATTGQNIHRQRGGILDYGS